MNHHKYISNFIPVALFILTSCVHGVKQKGLELWANPGGLQCLDTTRTIHIATTLFNPTNDTLSFVTMTCSYEDMFVTDTAVFKVQPCYNCYKNGPAVISIPPRGKLDQYIMIRPVDKNINIADYKIKIGMYLVAPGMENGFQRIVKQYEQRQNASVLWSNETDLQRLYRRVYK